MKVKITVTDDNNLSSTWSGTSADDFDRWATQIGSTFLKNDAHELIARTIDSLGEHHVDVKAAATLQGK